MNITEFKESYPAMDDVINAAYSARPWDYNNAEDFITYGLSRDLREAFTSEYSDLEGTGSDGVIKFFWEEITNINWGGI
jgi:hypothetical protein